MAFSSFFKCKDIPRLSVVDDTDSISGRVTLGQEEIVVERLMATMLNEDLSRTIFKLNHNDEWAVPKIKKMYPEALLAIKNPKNSEYLHHYFCVALKYGDIPLTQQKLALLGSTAIVSVSFGTMYRIDENGVVDFSPLSECRQLSISLPKIPGLNFQDKMAFNGIETLTSLHTLFLKNNDIPIAFNSLRSDHLSTLILKKFKWTNLDVRFPKLKTVIGTGSSFLFPERAPSWEELVILEKDGYIVSNKALPSEMKNLKRLSWLTGGKITDNNPMIYNTDSANFFKRFAHLDELRVTSFNLNFSATEAVKHHGRLRELDSRYLSVQPHDFTEISVVRITNLRDYPKVDLSKLFSTEDNMLEEFWCDPDIEVFGFPEDMRKCFPRLKSFSANCVEDPVKFAYLDKVELYNNPCVNVTPLAGCTEVKLYKCKNVDDINVLQNVEKLTVVDAPLITDVSKLGLVGELALIKLVNLRDISGLGLANESVNLSKCRNVRDYSCLANTPKVILAKCKNVISEDRDSDPANTNTLEQLRSVPYLDISWCQGVVSLKALHGTRWLKSWFARGVGASEKYDLEGIERLWGLSANCLSGTVELAGIEEYDPQMIMAWHATSAQSCWGGISDIRPLKNISILSVPGHRWLGVKGNPEKPWSIDKRINGLSYACLHGTMFTEAQVVEYFGEAEKMYNSGEKFRMGKRSYERKLLKMKIYGKLVDTDTFNFIFFNPRWYTWS